MAEAEARGRRMCLVVPGAQAAIETRGRFGVIHVVAARPAPGFDRRYHLLLPRHYLGTRSPIARILALERPAVVEVCDKYTLCHVARLARIGWYGSRHRPTLVGLSCERMDDNVAAYLSARAPVLAAARHYLRHVYGPSFDVHVANSGYTAAELRDYAGIDDVEVCPPGVDARLFAAARPDPSLRASLLASVGGDASSRLAFYAGRLSPEKNLPLLLQAIAALARQRSALPRSAPDVRLVVAGEGPQALALEALAARLAPGRVRFIGHVGDRRALATHYASADVFTHPNPREPFGIGPLEAMAAGVPVVLPRAGGVLCYAHDGNAWLAPPEPGAFARAISHASAGRDSARVRAAVQTAHAHARDVMAGRYFDLLDRRHAARIMRAAQPEGGARLRAAAAGR